ncbi:mechanosensitive ion channel family protein [Solidesulfovibrio magneticus]|uniref:Mechanosensitive ion channel family protein n=1 Tax=Solidesulfovibrio magneticus (strain ATCC 700980 / DSM 13731 / RS-1) TaxID=573370 RepID=C4XJQ6_SOLM1|nr:mechanosensitive ion channel family protein [Solidesulfovibrio magneticus]BAH76803.1 mechanosensitive ion channel family protein [Solidesulfovibrio magneticus RS-1]
MTATVRQRAVFLALALVMTLAWGVGPARAGINPAMPKAAKAPPAANVQEPTDPAQVDAFMATLTDAQARQLLHAKLAAKAKANEGEGSGQSSGLIQDVFEGLESNIRTIQARNAAFFHEAGQELGRHKILANLSDGGGAPVLLRYLLVLAAIMAGGVAAFLWTGRLRQGFKRRLDAAGPGPRPGRWLAILANLGLQLLEVAAFFVVASLLYLVLVPASGALRELGLLCVVGLTNYLCIQAAARVLLAPDFEAARPIPLADADAATLYRGMVAIALVCLVVGVVSIALEKVGQAEAFGDILYAQAGPLVGIMLAAMLYANRERVAAAIAGDGEPAGKRAFAARYGHVVAMVYVLAIGLYWSSQSLVGDATILHLVMGLFAIPACIGVDLWVRKLLLVASGEDREIIPLDAGSAAAVAAEQAEAKAEPDKRTLRYYIPLIRKALRLVLAAFAAFAMLKMWGVEIPLGWLFARNVLSVLLVVVGGLLAWEVVRIRIDRRLSEETSLPGEEMEEGGGAGGSRSATLLMLLRKFILSVIVVMGALIALSALGVDIAPLIAGAGVIGLAIGFGAQTLVKDIISGVFFLIDDAFRVGDYVEAGTAKGTVEQISLRSMKLRHPRGMVFTIPYGGLKILQNFSRDYIISKLDFRVRYDADIDKIRKIIKRINKEFLADEELSQGMLSDIKSMGVRKMEDSAMILRIKFKTVPGRQFVVQKELYRRVQEAFRKNGIEFAHRNVTVYFPPEMRGLAGGEQSAEQPAGLPPLAAAAAAAAAAAIGQDAERPPAKVEKADEEG